MKFPVQFVFVYWEDAHADFDMTSPTDALLKHKPAQAVTPGWLMVDNEIGVTVAGEYFPEDESYRAPSFIPRAMVTDVVPVTITRKRLKRSAPREAGDQPSSGDN